MSSRLQNIFSSKYDSNNWKTLLKDIFRNIENAFFENPIDQKEDEITKHKGVKHIWEFGDITIADNKVIKFYEVELLPGHEVTKNRVGLRNIIHTDLIPGYIDGIMVTFYNPEAADWRFTFISKTLYWNDENKEVKVETAPKRFTYLLGEGETIRTALNQFTGLIEKVQMQTPTLQNILDTFSVEKVSKEFYNGYIAQYEIFEKYLRTTTESYHLFDSLVNNLLLKQDRQNKTEFLIRNFVKKFLGRIVFLYFLQKKGWMGVPKNGDWGDGPRDFMSKFFNEWNNKNTFYTKALEPLFFETLNRDRSIDNDLFSVTNTRIPYLNGGLFEFSKDEPSDIILDPKLIEGLLGFFNQFNFTVDENQPNDQDVGVDPEMLSNIFENLLEDNKDKGAFYTPKEIVHYMTEESLLEYLVTTCPEIDGADLKKLVKKKEIGDLNDDEQRDIDTALDKVKICDPAIGSGAFPMGLLIEIFAIKSILAFENGWIAGSPAKIKQKIIENSIYGVDIEYGAVDIARLRFWLSLIVEEETPHALPNLDYKIVCGDSLLSQYQLNASITTVLENYNKGRSKDDKLNVKGYKALMHKYLNATDKSEKEKHRSAIEEIKDTFKSEFENKDKENIRDARGDLLNFQVVDLYTGKTKGTKAQITKAKKKLLKLETKRSKVEKASKYKDAIEWRFQFPNLLSNKTGAYEGFDIVIGNPPYIQLQNEKGRLAKLYEKEGYKTFVRSGDIYSLFYERGNQILKEGGVLTYITSNKWMRAKYGQSTRNYFLEDTTISKLIDFGDAKLFENATTYTNILVFKKGTNKNYIPTVYDISNIYKKGLDLELCLKHNNDYAGDLVKDGFLITDAKKLAIKKQIEKIGKPLSRWNVNIYRGILTGYNEAFLIDGSTKEMLVEKDPRSKEILKPVVRGRNIKRYKLDYQNSWLINTHNGYRDKNIGEHSPIDIEDYKYIKNHLDQFSEELNKRSDKGITPYNLRNCAYLDDFDGEKLMWLEMSPRPNFIYVNKPMYALNSAYMLVGKNLKYLVAVLNSKVLDYYFSFISTDVNGGTRRYTKQFVERLPIPQIIKEKQTYFEILVDFIQYLKSNDTQINEYVSNIHIAEIFEEVINAMVFELFFPEDFSSSDVSINEHVTALLLPFNHLNEDITLEIIHQVYRAFKDPSSKLRNNMKLMDIRLDQIINLIKSI